MNIPFYTVSYTPRTKIPAFVYDLLKDWKASHVFANLEYEVDELRRDLALCRLANEQGKVVCTFVHDKCVVAPGDVRTKEGRGYTVRISGRWLDDSSLPELGVFALPEGMETSPGSSNG